MHVPSFLQHLVIFVTPETAGSPGGSSGRLWGSLGGALGQLWEALAELWEALGELLEGLDELWVSFLAGKKSPCGHEPQKTHA